jgi:hypothetical protein
VGSERVVKVPDRYRGGLAEEAYRAGWTAGRRSKELDTIGLSVMMECTSEIAQNGIGRLLSVEGATEVMNRLGKRLEKFKKVKNEVGFADRLRRMEAEQKKKGRST